MKYKYMSNWSGEIVTNLFEAIKASLLYAKDYPFEWKMFDWKYNKKGW